MRKFVIVEILLMACIVFAYSCSSITTEGLINDSHKISQSEAISRLNSIFSDIYGIVPCTSANFSINTKSQQLSSDLDTLIYCISFNDGYTAILSADDRLPDPVIAVVESDAFSPIVRSEETDSLQMFITGLLNNYLQASLVQYTEDNGGGGEEGDDDEEHPDSGPDEGDDEPEAPYSYFRVPPMLPLLWGQKSPYNDNCPIIGNVKAKVGCVSLSSAMLMAYELQDEEVSVSNALLSWDDIWDVAYRTLEVGDNSTGLSDLQRLLAYLRNNLVTDVNDTTSAATIRSAEDFLGYYIPSVETHSGYRTSDKSRVYTCLADLSLS